MIEKIIVYEDRFAVEFKSGASVDVERNHRKNFIAPKTTYRPLAPCRNAGCFLL